MLTKASDDLKELDELQLEQNISFAKVTCFIDAILNDSIVITADNLPHYEKTLCEFSNNYILVPDTIDNTFISILLSKFNSIVGNNTQVNSITLFDLDDQLRYRLEIFDEDDDDDIVDIKEWLGEFVLSNIPWWQRGDESTWDGSANSQDEYDIIKSNEDEDTKESIFDEIDDTIRSMYKSMYSENNDSEAEVIEVDFQSETKKKKWKPKIV
jgi:hypothetical protein